MFDALTNCAFSHLDPPALQLVCMTEENVKRKIQVLKQEPKFNEILKLKRLPPRRFNQQQDDQQGDQQAAAQGTGQQVPSAPQGDDQQPSTSADSSVPTQRKQPEMLQVKRCWMQLTGQQVKYLGRTSSYARFKECGHAIQPRLWLSEYGGHY